MRTVDTSYPLAQRRPVVDQLHGRAVTDPYRWLEDGSAPDTRIWQAGQDELWSQHARGFAGRDRFRARIAEFSAVGLVAPPRWRGDRQFFLRRTAEQQHPVLYVVRPGQAEEALVDPMRLDPSGLTTLDRWQPDPAGRLLALQFSRGGAEQSVLFVVDVDSGQQLDGPLDRCRYSPVAWAPDGKSFYYVRSGLVRRHRVGGSDDTPLLEATASYGLDLSADGRWLTVSASHETRNDVWLADLSVEPPTMAVVQQGIDARTAATVGPDGRMYVVTTLGAANGRICTADPTEPGHAHWRELVGEDPDAPLTDVALLEESVLVGRIRHTLGEIDVHDLRTGARVGGVPLPGLGSVGALTTRPEGGHEAWFSYTDSITPATVHRYDAHTGTTTWWSRSPGAVELPEVAAHQLTYQSADGTDVRMLVLAGPGPAGPRPTILYGYGGFGQPLTPAYSSFALAWVAAGGVFVTANLRGGGEYGEHWHRAGMLDRKQNVFDDFIAAAERLIADGWTTPDRLGICGESNGGLLVGAALTQRPDLFAAAVCSAPVLDMVRFERSGLGPSWVAEYGSAADPDQLAWLLGYSPYHRVRDGIDYPAVLFTVFGGDTRVDPMHARKMCAALQHATTSDRPVLLRREEGAGHGPGAVHRGVELAADMLAFFATHTGLAGP